MNEWAINRKNLHRCWMSSLVFVFVGLISLATSACDAMNKRIPDVDKEFGAAELQVNNQMTVRELAGVANDLIHDWQPQAYLHALSLRLTYDGYIRAGVFDYVSKKGFLGHERQAIAQVTFRFEENKVILHAADVNSSGPPDTRLNLAELETDIHLIVAAANAQGGTEYCERVVNCTVAARLIDSTWIISYGPPGEIIHDLEIKLDAQK